MKLIDLTLIGACCFFLSVSGLETTNHTRQAGGVITDNYGCVAPNDMGCFPYGSLVCVNPTNDPNNCGACGADCPAAGATPAIAATCTTAGCTCPQPPNNAVSVRPLPVKSLQSVIVRGPPVVQRVQRPL